jgi:xanthine dehydrogenase accessory factor
MRDVLPDIERWRAEAAPIALATVVETWGSAPRTVGSKMAVTADRRISGSVSGGCVENAVIEAAVEVLASGQARLLHFGVSTDTAWGVGLACGGTIDVFVEPLRLAVFEPLRDALHGERSAASATLIRGPEDRVGQKLAVLADGATAGAIDGAALAATQAALAGGPAGRIALGDSEIFVEVLLPSPRLIFAKALGFRAILVDPRESFANPERFPHADEILSEWPDRALAKLAPNASTAIAVLTHDPKLDDPALIAALRSPAFYVGALGSRRTHEKRRERLLAGGMTEPELARLHAPIGLDLGGRSPEEIALSVVAQIVGVRSLKM